MKKVLLLALSLVLLSNALFSIGFGYHVLDVRTSPEFGKGVYPTSVEYQFNFPMPGDTLLTFRLDNGLDFRTIRQDPESGKLYAEYGYIGAIGNVHDYSVLFDEFNLLFSQGLVRTRFSNNNLINISAALGGRFELAFEDLSFMSDSSHTESLFWSDTSGTNRFSSFSGTPELAGDRSVMHTFLTFGLSIDMYKDDVVVKNGIKASSTLRICPVWMPMNDGTAEYIASINEISLAYTPVAIEQKGNKELHWFSFVIGNDLVYRYIAGSKVPYYIQGGDIFSVRAANTEHLITNRTYVSLYGPQIKVNDLYPSLMLFHDFAYSCGNVLNMSNPDTIGEYCGVFGLRAEFNMYNICKFYYEVGTIYAEQFSHERSDIKARFGFTLEI